MVPLLALASQFALSLPDWLRDQLQSLERVYATEVERMEFDKS